MPSWLLPPNLITYVRLVLAPMAANAIVEGRHQQALALVLAAGISDAIDGFLARHFHWKTRIGAYLDPLADKLLLVLVFVSLGIHGSIPWWLIVLFLLRDVWILAMVSYAWQATPIRDFPPRILGKLTTVSQIALALVMLVANAYPSLVPTGIPTVAVLAAAALTVASGVDYTASALRRYREWARTGSH